MSDFQAKFADALAEAMRRRDEAHRFDDKEARFAERTEWAELLETEMADALSKLGLPGLHDPDQPPEIQQFLQFMKQPQHQVDVIFTIFAMVGAALTAVFAMAAGFNQRLTNDGLRLHGFAIPDPGVLAEMRARQFLTDSEAADAISYTGTKSPITEAWWKAGYSHLSPIQALELWRRGDISEATFDEICTFNGLADNDRTWLKLLRIGPLDYGTAVAAVTQSQISPVMFRILLEQNGVDPGWADVIYKTAGASPPVEMTLELWNRDLIDEATVDKIVLESPIKNEYVDVIKRMRHRFPALEQTTTLIRRRIMTPEEGFDAITKLGYTDDLANKMVEYAFRSETDDLKELSMSVITQLYDEQLIDRATAANDLAALDYTPAQVDLLLQLAERKRDRRRLTQAVNRTHTKYVTYKIDEPEAIGALDRLGVPTAAREEYLETWAIEREISTLHFTRADLKKAVKLNAMTPDAAMNRLRGMGWDDADIAVLRIIDGYDAPPE